MPWSSAAELWAIAYYSNSDIVQIKLQNRSHKGLDFLADHINKQNFALIFISLKCKRGEKNSNKSLVLGLIFNNISIKTKEWNLPLPHPNSAIKNQDRKLKYDHVALLQKNDY